MDKERQHIDELLRRFMEGESTLDEERFLGEWFRSHEVDETLEPYRQMFAYFDAGMPTSQRPAAKRSRRVWWQVAAAAMLTALMAWAGVRLLTKPDVFASATTTTAETREILIVTPADDEPEETIANKPTTPVKPVVAVKKRHHAAQRSANIDSAEIAHTEATLELAESEYQAEQAELQWQLQQLRQQQHTRQNGWVTVSLPCQ